MNDIKLLEYAKKHTAAGTNVVVEPFPGATYAQARYVIDELEVGGDVAGTLQILDDNNVAIDGYFFTWGAGGSTVIRFPLKKIPKGRGFRYTTTGGGNHAVKFKYHLEQNDPD